EGHCKVYRLSEGGREHVLATLGPGDSCNEVPVVDGGPNPANFAALEDSTVWIISAEALQRLRRKHPALNDMIIKNLAMRCRQLVKRVYNLSFLSVTGPGRLSTGTKRRTQRVEPPHLDPGRDCRSSGHRARDGGSGL
ncbi:MAG TPA: Crp/Fnr family transcriptional regulator, partial [Anaerolineae bacterium]|nr:Crp/Fnr family transcriptional regulator [Anaerolineae bacterium]